MSGCVRVASTRGNAKWSFLSHLIFFDCAHVSAVVAVYIKQAAAAAWLMRVPLGGTPVAVGHCWVAFRVWLKLLITHQIYYDKVCWKEFIDQYFNRFMLFFIPPIVSNNVILLKSKLKITNHNIYDGDDGPKNYDDVNDDDDIFGCNVPVGTNDHRMGIHFHG